MGSSSSQPAKNLDERTYLLPEDRAKERFIPRENEAQSALFDPSVDKVSHVLPVSSLHNF